ncbi:MAG: DNA repair protein RecO [Proteobacteria bacterium]|nr:DNA repair protein RecO [Pseudomonadota bacterium]
MEWQDEGVVIGLKRHGESSVIMEAMTRAHGRHLGLVRGGRSRRHAATLQPGNSVSLTWRARLEDHLGTYEVEPLILRAAGFIDSAAALYALATVSAHLRLLPERDVHLGLYEALLVLVDHLSEPRTIGVLLARFERALLDDLGFGLDLDRCAATGAAEDLVWVSPKSGRAVSAAAGAPYADRLLPLPAFLRGEGTFVPPGAIDHALRLTGFFLERHVLHPRGLAMPDQRAVLLALAGA